MSVADLFDALARYRGAYAGAVGIGLVCAWLGVHCVHRRIVFTGAALAQLAATGVALALFVAARVPEPLAGAIERSGATACSLGLSLLGALGLRARGQDSRLTADGRVGLVYAGASALAVLFVWRSAHGPGELANILAGELLLARPGELLALAVGLVVVGAVHLRWRRELLLVAFDAEFARAIGVPERRLQLAFFATLAVAVALSLRAAGLLLIFADLALAPAAALLLGEGTVGALLVAPAAAAGAALLGFLAAIAWDLPVAPTIAATLLLLGVVAWVSGRVERARRPLRAALLGLGALAVLVALSVWLVPVEERAALALHEHPQAHLHGPAAPGDAPPPAAHEASPAAARELADDPDAAVRVRAALCLGATRDPGALGALLPAQQDEDPDVRRAVVVALRALAREPSVRAALAAAGRDPDPERRLGAALALLGVGDPAGLDGLVAALADPDLPPYLRGEALAPLLDLPGAPTAPAYDIEADPAQNAAALAAWRDLLERTRGRWRWDAATARLRVE